MIVRFSCERRNFHKQRILVETNSLIRRKIAESSRLNSKNQTIFVSMENVSSHKDTIKYACAHTSHLFCLSFSFSVFCACSFTFTISIILTIYLIAISFTSIHSKYVFSSVILLLLLLFSFFHKTKPARTKHRHGFLFFFFQMRTHVLPFPSHLIKSLFFIQLHMLCFITFSISFLPHT